jgi:hypothetical protein
MHYSMGKSERHFTVPSFKQQRVPHQETQAHFHNMQIKQISKQYSHLQVKFAEPLEVMLGYAHHPQEYDRSNHECCKIPFDENSDDRLLVKQFLAAKWKAKLGHHLNWSQNLCELQGYNKAQCNLGTLYRKGIGVEQVNVSFIRCL